MAELLEVSEKYFKWRLFRNDKKKSGVYGSNYWLLVVYISLCQVVVVSSLFYCVLKLPNCAVYNFQQVGLETCIWWKYVIDPYMRKIQFNQNLYGLHRTADLSLLSDDSLTYLSHNSVNTFCNHYYTGQNFNFSRLLNHVFLFIHGKKVPGTW